MRSPRFFYHKSDILEAPAGRWALEGVRVQRSTTYIIALCVLLATAGAAVASGGEEHSLPWGNFALRILNFALFAGILVYFFGKKAVAFFKNRTTVISNEIASLEDRKAQAAQTLEDVGRRIADLENERKAILADYEAQGEALKAAIIAQGEKSAAQIVAQAKATAQNETQAALNAMRDQMADRIVEATQKLLAEKLTEAEHAKLIDKYVTKVVLN